MLQSERKFIIIDIASDKQHIKIQIENSSLPIKTKNNIILTTKRMLHFMV